VTDRNFLAVQQELVQTRQRFEQLKGAYKQLESEAQRFIQQGQQVEAEKVVALSWLLAVLLEHHQGEATVMMPLVKELTDGQEVYGTKTKLEDGKLTIQVTDTKGNAVERTSLETTVAIKSKAQEAEPAIVHCEECKRAEPLHWAWCSKEAL
jgi:hypothetical protein